MANSSNASLTLLTDSCCEERQGGREEERQRYNLDKIITKPTTKGKEEPKCTCTYTLNK